MPKSILIALIAAKSAVPNFANNNEPKPISRITPIAPRVIKINGNQALRSDADGIIVLLTVKIR